MNPNQQLRDLQDLTVFMQKKLKRIETHVKKQDKIIQSRRDVRLKRPAAARYLGYSNRHFKRLMDEYPEYLSFSNKLITIGQLERFEQFYKQQKGVRL